VPARDYFRGNTESEWQHSNYQKSGTNGRNRAMSIINVLFSEITRSPLVSFVTLRLLFEIMKKIFLSKIHERQANKVSIKMIGIVTVHSTVHRKRGEAFHRSARKQTRYGDDSKQNIVRYTCCDVNTISRGVDINCTRRAIMIMQRKRREQVIARSSAPLSLREVISRPATRRFEGKPRRDVGEREYTEWARIYKETTAEDSLGSYRIIDRRGKAEAELTGWTVNADLLKISTIARRRMTMQKREASIRRRPVAPLRFSRASACFNGVLWCGSR